VGCLAAAACSTMLRCDTITLGALVRMVTKMKSVTWKSDTCLGLDSLETVFLAFPVSRQISYPPVTFIYLMQQPNLDSD